MINLLAARVGGVLNMSDISRMCGIQLATIKRYLSLLKILYLYVELPSWSKSVTKRTIKAPKVYFSDTDLLCSLLDVDNKRLRNDRIFLGHLKISYIVSS